MSLFTPELVKKMLDYVDFNPKRDRNSKRRDAYVTERYFETNILPLVAKGSTSTGWCYIEEQWVRHWFKVVVNIGDNDPERETDKQIIEQLKRHDSKQTFYIVFIDSAQETETISIRQIINDDKGWKLKKLQDPPDFCDIEAMNTEALRLSSLPHHPNPFCAQWMKNCDDLYMKSLLIQRLLMNNALADKFPLDVDAIEINDGQLIFHEFKRKNKCPNGCFIINNNHVTRFKISDIIKKCNKEKLSYGLELFNYVEQEFRYSRDENKQCYGLDMSHFGNFEYCTKKNIIFLHSIWDSENYPDKPRISDLFSADIKPIKEMHLVSAILEARNFIGFIFTQGSNSGSFTKKLRGQATMDANAFKDIQVKNH